MSAWRDPGQEGAVTTGRRITGCFWAAGYVLFSDLSVGYTVRL